MKLLAIVVPTGLLTGIAVSVMAAWISPQPTHVAAVTAIAVSKPVVKAVDQIEPEPKLELVEEKTDLTVPPPLPAARPVVPQASGVQWDFRKYRYRKRERRKRW